MNTQKQINNYIARQSAWVKANNITIGTKVLVLRRYENYSNGWDNTWVTPMSPGLIDTIAVIKDCGISMERTSYYYPYTVLLPLDPNGKYEEKTFISGKDNKEYRCIVDMNSIAKLGEFCWQTDTYWNNNPLRKVTCLRYNDFTIDEDMKTTAKEHGYFIVSESISNSLQLPKVIASELHIPWLPRLQY